MMIEDEAKWWQITLCFYYFASKFGHLIWQEFNGLGSLAKGQESFNFELHVCSTLQHLALGIVKGFIDFTTHQY